MCKRAITTVFAVIGTLLSACSAASSQYDRTSSCPSAATVRRVLENQDYWRHTTFTLSPDVTCVGPYVMVRASNSAGSSTRILLEQEAMGLRFLVAGSGPICTVVRSDAEPGQLVYIPPRYGHALLCVNGTGMALLCTPSEPGLSTSGPGHHRAGAQNAGPVRSSAQQPRSGKRT
jgi:hypothetical protein